MPPHELVILDDVHAEFGIAEVAARSGLTPDTLRWYEREGIMPAVRRGSDRRRKYTQRDAAMVAMLAGLRAGGMPTEEMREFSRLVEGGAATHGRRLALLERHRARLEQRRAEVDAHLRVLDGKTEHYRFLIETGLDCDGVAVTADVAQDQGRRE